MPALALLYPSPSLAAIADPLDLARLTPDASLDDVRAWAAERASDALSALPAGATDGPVDQRWYWAAPLLLDRVAGHGAWWNEPDLATFWTGGEETARDDTSLWQEHVEYAAAVAADGLELGRRPDDLPEVLGLLSMASPGTCALRALRRATGAPVESEIVLDAAASIAWSLRSIFNTAEASTLIAAESEEARWRAVLLHCADGCLQAVFDEFAHVLLESEGPQNSRRTKPRRDSPTP